MEIGTALVAPEGVASRTDAAPALWESGAVPTLLIVDDHPTFRETARALLEAEGFDVVGEAADGESALAEAARLRPEVVLLDVQLPDIDGFEVMARLAAAGHPPEVVLTSSRDAADFGTLVEDCGACGFVAKHELSGRSISALLA